jgi:hypothetical protein
MFWWGVLLGFIFGVLVTIAVVVMIGFKLSDG